MTGLENRKIVFWSIWILILLIPIATVLRNMDISLAAGESVYLTNLIQRFTGLTAFTLVFLQLIIGSNLDFWIQFIGSKAYRLHVTQGLLAYVLIFSHPLFENILAYQVSRRLTAALAVFIPSIVSRRDIFLVYGRSAFLLFTIAVIAGYFRTRPFFRRNWRFFHYLNYLAFYLVAIHGRVGTDFNTNPFRLFYLVSVTVVTGQIVYKFILLKLVKTLPRAEKVSEK